MDIPEIKVEDGVKIAGAALLISYGLGTIASNLFLSQYGVYDFSLVRPREVITGFLFALYCFVCLAPYEFFIRLYNSPWAVDPKALGDAVDQNKWILFRLPPPWFPIAKRVIHERGGRFFISRFVVFPLVAWVFYLASSILIFYFLTVSTFDSGDLRPWVHLALGVVIGQVTVTIAIFAVASEFRSNVRIVPIWRRLLMYAGSPVALMLLFSQMVYPELPTAVGGGRGRTEYLFLTDETPQEVVKSLTVGCACYAVPTEGGNLSGYVIAETENSLVFEARDLKSAFRLDKKYVAAESWSSKGNYCHYYPMKWPWLAGRCKSMIKLGWRWICRS